MSPIRPQVEKYSLVLDVGTSGVKALLFDQDLRPISRAHAHLSKKHPRHGWVEQNPDELVLMSEKVLREALQNSGVSPRNIAGIGITNQRETTILWDKRSGRAAYPAIVWEDRRTQKICDKLAKEHNFETRQRAGLPIDSYFSASKIRWILDNVLEAKKLDKAGYLLFGTVDTWVMWNLLEKRPHVTDYTNASRTLLFNIQKLRWDPKLFSIFGASSHILPRVLPSVAFFGNLREDVLGLPIPVRGVCGDQQASMYAVGVARGETKITYGTGAFLVQVAGSKFILRDPFFTTLMPGKDRPLYALEAKIEDCGKSISVLLKKPKELRAFYVKLAKAVDHYIKKLPIKPGRIFIDGGATRDGSLAKIQSKISGIKIQSQKVFDGTALGVARLIKETY